MEKDLFGPIKAYFEALGYSCDGEVGDIDLYMEKDGEKAAVELKLSLDFKAVQQAALRQKMVDTVYVGTYKPKDMFTSSHRDKMYLLKRLGIGWIVLSEKTGEVKVINEPIIRELSTFKARNKKKGAALSKEFSKRRLHGNVGGVNKEKLITSYREDALLVLDALCELGGESDTRSVHKLSKIDRTAAILRANHYHWFERTGKGIYRVSEKGYDALEEFEEVLAKLKKGFAN